MAEHLDEKEITVNRTYKSRLFEIKFVIFYNGEEEQPERVELKLSDAFTVAEENPALEVRVVMLNINPGYNREIMETCKTLADYAEYTARVRKYAEGIPYGHSAVSQGMRMAARVCCHFYIG